MIAKDPGSSTEGSSDPAPSKPYPATTVGFADRVLRQHEREVASEMPVQVAFADIPFGIMMMTPADLEDFAFGFSLTEGVIEHATDVRGTSVEHQPGGLALRIDLKPSRLQAHLARKRAMAGRTSCGLCGIEDFDALPRAAAPHGEGPALDLLAVEQSLTGLASGQGLNAATHAVHAAAWADCQGRILLLREDVGRHNALDKLVGACLRSGIDPHSGFILVTSRASYEMVEKAATFGCRTLVAVSAPTALAIERAKTLDLTLLGIARRDAVTIFHGAERVRFDKASA